MSIIPQKKSIYNKNIAKNRPLIYNYIQIMESAKKEGKENRDKYALKEKKTRVLAKLNFICYIIMFIILAADLILSIILFPKVFSPDLEWVFSFFVFGERIVYLLLMIIPCVISLTLLIIHCRKSRKKRSNTVPIIAMVLQIFMLYINIGGLFGNHLIINKATGFKFWIGFFIIYTVLLAFLIFSYPFYIHYNKALINDKIWKEKSLGNENKGFSFYGKDLNDKETKATAPISPLSDNESDYHQR